MNAPVGSKAAPASSPESEPVASAPVPAAPYDDALRAMYTDSCARITPNVVRAYGVALTWWMTGRPGFDMGPGPQGQQHARIAHHFRRVLGDTIEQDVDVCIQRRIADGAWPRELLNPGHANLQGRQSIRAQAQARAQALFLRGQYSAFLLLFFVIADLQRQQEHASVMASLQGAAGGLPTGPPAPPPHGPEREPC